MIKKIKNNDAMFVEWVLYINIKLLNFVQIKQFMHSAAYLLFYIF